MRRYALLVAAAVVAAAVLFGRGAGRQPVRVAGRTLTPAPAGGGEAAAPAGGDADGGASTLGRRPRSLRGTRVDGGLGVDAAGRFVPTLDVRRLFDHFLAASGEEAPGRTRDRIVAAIRRRLAAEPARDAVDLLDRYLRWREEARVLGAGGELPDDLGARLERLHELRWRVLGPEAAEAFFAAEEAMARGAIERRRVLADATLSAGERAQRLAALDAALPPDVLAVRQQLEARAQLARDEARLRAGGATDGEIHALRERTFGTAAADRLAALDRERAAWEARLDAYRQARAALDADASRTPAARAAAADGLLRAHFPSEAERLRARALVP
jgi:lipase chaperone LimK